MTSSFITQVRRALTRAADTSAELRRLVLTHPDLAAQLTQPPLDFAQPGQWSGYLPPATYRQTANHSPVREALLAIVTEAARRDDQPNGSPRHDQD